MKDPKISRKSWHYKLHNWTIGTPPQFNFCPYFWLTVLSVFLAPFKFTIVTLFRPVLKVIEFIGVRFEAYLDRRIAEWIDKELTYDKLVSIVKHKKSLPWFFIFSSIKTSKFMLVKIYCKKTGRDDYWGVFDELLGGENEEVSKPKDPTWFDKNVVSWVNKNSLVIKMWAGKVLFGLAGLFAVGVFGALLIEMFIRTPLMMIITGILIGAGIVFLAIMATVGVVKLVELLGSAKDFIMENYCPGIVWVEEESEEDDENWDKD